MADKELEILISTLAKTHGADQVTEALNKTKEAAVQEGEALKETGKAAEHAEGWHHKLHGATRALAREMHKIPIVGHLIHSIFNKTAFVVVALAGAFEILQHKLELVSHADIPESSPLNPERIDAATEAWERLGDAVQKAKDNFNGAAEAADRAAKAFDNEVERWKKAHPESKAEIDVEAERTRRKMDEAKAAALEKSAKDKMARAGAIHIGTKEQDDQAIHNQEAEVERLKKESDEADERLKKLDAYDNGSMSVREKAAYAASYLYDYGTSSHADVRDFYGKRKGDYSRAKKNLEDMKGRQHDRDWVRSQRTGFETEAAAEAAQAQTIRSGLSESEVAFAAVSGANDYSHGGAHGEHGTVSNKDAAALAATRAALARNGWTYGEIMAIMKDMTDNQRTMASRMDELKVALGTVKATVRDAHNHGT